MKSILLAAGYATRLYPLTQNFPKALLQVGRYKILEWLLQDIDSLPDITEHIIVSNHAFYPAFDAWRKENAGRYAHPVTLLDDGTLDNEHRLGAVMDMELAYRSDEAVSADPLKEVYLILAGDNVLDFSLGSFVEFHRNKQAAAIMYYEENDLEKQRRTGIIRLGSEQLVIEMQEKPTVPVSNLAVPPFYCYTGRDLHRISQAVSEGCGKDSPGSFAAWLCRHSAVYGYPMPGCRYDIGTMESYRMAQQQYHGILHNEKQYHETLPPERR